MTKSICVDVVYFPTLNRFNFERFMLDDILMTL